MPNKLFVSSNHDIHAYTDADEERVALIKGYYKGVSFELVTPPGNIERITKKLPHTYIADSLRRGISIKEQREFWTQTLNNYEFVYTDLMERQALKYLGKSVKIVIDDIIERTQISDDIKKGTIKAEDSTEYFISEWILGICLLVMLKVIDNKDETNGYLVFTAPRGILQTYDDIMLERTLAEVKKMERESEPTATP